METVTLNIKTGKNQDIPERNIKILKMLSEGMRPDKIAKELFMSKRTVEHHIFRMRHINGFDNVYALIAAAAKANII